MRLEAVLFSDAMRINELPARHLMASVPGAPKHISDFTSPLNVQLGDRRASILC